MALKPFEVDGIVLDTESVADLRQLVIDIRDTAIEHSKMQLAFDLSLVVALMSKYLEAIKEGT